MQEKWPAPIGYINKNKQLDVDRDRAPLVCEAFELMASGRHVTADSVLQMVTALGLTTRRGRKLTKQSFARMIANPIYQKALNQMAIKARVKGNTGQEDFDTIKTEIAEETKQIQAQITALDSENATMEGLMHQADVETIDLVAAWNNGNVN